MECERESPLNACDGPLLMYHQETIGLGIRCRKHWYRLFPEYRLGARIITKEEYEALSVIQE
jgi:hypothetical protein